jgi:hypothetical protein
MPPTMSLTVGTDALLPAWAAFPLLGLLLHAVKPSANAPTVATRAQMVRFFM